jgi:hypothetical protein
LATTTQHNGAENGANKKHGAKKPDNRNGEVSARPDQAGAADWFMHDALVLGLAHVSLFDL